MIAKDVTAPFVEGWDWILPVPDRNTGIWDHVELSYTGPVALQV
jgi:mannosylglycoprotein endo-beta-mannosidase